MLFTNINSSQRVKKFFFLKYLNAFLVVEIFLNGFVGLKIENISYSLIPLICFIIHITHSMSDDLSPLSFFGLNFGTSAPYLIAIF